MKKGSMTSCCALFMALAFAVYAEFVNGRQ
jgi:hypothetical protein